MRIQFTIRRHHKRDEVAADCADALAADPSQGLFAVADGVSSAIFAGAWAECLAQGALAKMPDELSASGIGRWLRPLRQEMTQRIDDQVADKPWYVKQKTRDGSASTLMLGQYARREGDGWCLYLWNVGDSNLIWSPVDEAEVAWPAADAAVFDRLPPQLSSRPTAVRGFHRREQHIHEGDRVVVATDAVAKWLLREMALVAAETRHEWLAQWAEGATGSDESWAEWVEAEREAGRLENDDSSVLVAVHGADASAEVEVQPLAAPTVPAEGWETDQVLVPGGRASAPAASGADLRTDEAERPFSIGTGASEAVPGEPAPPAPQAIPDGQDPGQAAPPRCAADEERIRVWREDLDFALEHLAELPKPEYKVKRKAIEPAMKQLRKSVENREAFATQLAEHLQSQPATLPMSPDGLCNGAKGRPLEGDPAFGCVVRALGLEVAPALVDLFARQQSSGPPARSSWLLAWWWAGQNGRHTPPPLEAVMYEVLAVCDRYAPAAEG